VLGTSTAALLSTHSQLDFLSETHGILASSLAPGLVSPEEAIEDFREQFHWYSVSQMDGRRHWRHAPIDFSGSRTAGRLTATIPACNRRGELQRYACHAGLVDERFVHINKAMRGKESASIYVYPSLGKDFYDVHCGFGLKESWDGTPLIVPAILTRSPMGKHDADLVGDVTDPDAVAQLNAAWLEGMRGTDALVPVEAPVAELPEAA
jgi:hypothetical protein